MWWWVPKRYRVWTIGHKAKSPDATLILMPEAFRTSAEWLHYDPRLYDILVKKHNLKLIFLQPNPYRIEPRLFGRSKGPVWFNISQNSRGEYVCDESEYRKSIKALTEIVQKEDKVIIAGVEQGGVMALAAACHIPYKFLAVASFGGFHLETRYPKSKVNQGTPILMTTEKQSRNRSNSDVKHVQRVCDSHQRLRGLYGFKYLQTYQVPSNTGLLDHFEPLEKFLKTVLKK